MMRSVLPVLFFSALLASCGEPRDSGHSHTGDGSHSHEAAPKAGEHGAGTDLGKVTVAGRGFVVVRLGELVPGEEGAIEVAGIGMSSQDLKALNLYLWVESRDGTQLSAPGKGHLEGDRLHFHVTPRAGEKTPFRVVLRVRADGVDERGSLPLDGHGHEHPEGSDPHGGH